MVAPNGFQNEAPPDRRRTERALAKPFQAIQIATVKKRRVTSRQFELLVSGGHKPFRFLAVRRQEIVPFAGREKGLIQFDTVYPDQSYQDTDGKFAPTKIQGNANQCG